MQHVCVKQQLGSCVQSIHVVALACQFLRVPCDGRAARVRISRLLHGKDVRGHPRKNLCSDCCRTRGKTRCRHSRVQMFVLWWQQAKTERSSAALGVQLRHSSGLFSQGISDLAGACHMVPAGSLESGYGRALAAPCRGGSTTFYQAGR